MKKITLLLLVVMSIFMITSCSLKNEPKGTITVGLECNYAPFNWAETTETDSNIPINGKSSLFAEGYDIQMAKRIAKE